MRRQNKVDLAFGAMVWVLSSVRGFGRCAPVLVAVVLAMLLVAVEAPSGSMASAPQGGHATLAAATVRAQATGQGDLPGGQQVGATPAAASEAAAVSVSAAMATPVVASVSRSGPAPDGVPDSPAAAPASLAVPAVPSVLAMPHTVSLDDMHRYWKRTVSYWRNPFASALGLDPDSVDPQPSTAKPRRTLFDPARLAALHPGRDGAAAESVRKPAVARLSAEQRNIARFISKRYRVELEHTREIVFHAYDAAREFGVDPLLVLAIVSVESSFNASAESHKGAQGLMQVHTRVHREKFEPYGGVHAAFDPRVNLRVGTRILREYIERGGDIETGLKFYVGAALLEHDFGYARKVLAARARIAAAASSDAPATGERTQASAGDDGGSSRPRTAS